MMHIKDGINIAGQPSPTDSRAGSPRPTGTGELDFRPIFAAAKGKVQYYHHEHDGGTITDADTSFTNLHADRPVHRSGACSACRPRSRPSPAGTAGRRERRRREDHQHGPGRR